MASKDNAKKLAKEYAKLLYTTTDMSQKEIAERVGVSQQSMTKWVNGEMWEYLRTSLITTKSDQLRRYYLILESITKRIEDAEEAGGDTKLADMSIKYTTVIKNLETKVSAGAMFETGMGFIRFVMGDDMALAQKITDYFDAFIQKELNARW